MSLEILVQKAKDLINVEKFGESDPFVEVEFQGRKEKTEVVKSNLNPEFNARLKFDLGGVALSPGDSIIVRVFDHEKVGRNRLLGKVNVSLAPAVNSGQPMQKSSTRLSSGKDEPLNSTIDFVVTYTPPPGAGPQAGVGAKVAAGAVESDVVLRGAGNAVGVGPMEVGVSGDVEGDGLETVMLGGGGGGDGEGSERSGSPDRNGVGGPTGRKKRKRKGAATQIQHKLGNKPVDFQIRVKLVEGRQLAGGNVSPTVQIAIGNQSKKSKVIKSTNAPAFHETFFFNCNKVPNRLFEDLMDIRVYDSKAFRSDSKIGSFSCDVGLVYSQPSHAILNKWLLLSDSDNPAAGGKGYLKVCICVLGPGDEAPSFKHGLSEAEDIEANLIKSPGVRLCPAQVTLKLFKAEDIPRMDSNTMEKMKNFFVGGAKKEHVDPYFTFSFAGKEVESEVKMQCASPDWNQLLKLGFSFPSLCDELVFRMFDWDRLTENDPVATTKLLVSQISACGAGEGFLPKFGPCFVNFYGAPREFQEIAIGDSDLTHLNKGLGPGCAYRGRALVEINTTLGEKLDESAENEALEMIPREEILKLQPFLRRRKFRLHAAFLDACMIEETDGPIEFEVSIGNYGNKLDEDTPPCSSSTQPTHAVFDGNHYHYLPWGLTKPICVVDSHWEDISYRLESLNILLKAKDKLSANIAIIETSIKAKAEKAAIASLIIDSLEELLVDCSVELPMPIPGTHRANELDKSLLNYRNTELTKMKQAASRLREYATDVDEALAELQGYFNVLNCLAVEPQNSMPDVIIWMLVADKRTAYIRIPAYDLLYSDLSHGRGRQCGNLQTLYLSYPCTKTETEESRGIPVQLRIQLWLGLEKFQDKFDSQFAGGEIATYAENYENQSKIPIKGWGSCLTRPDFSDLTGKMRLNQDSFDPPAGWEWASDWYISPEMSRAFEKDAGRNIFTDEIYENEWHIPRGAWGPPKTNRYTDINGDEAPSLEEFPLPAGWEWVDEAWNIDMNRACDDYGWEYTVEATLNMGWSPVEKNYHACRRRRLVRTRKLNEAVDRKALEKKKEQELAQSEGWEYATTFEFNAKFHAKPKMMDMARRRRWHRKLVKVKQDAGEPIFSFEDEGSDSEDEDEIIQQVIPKIFLTFKDTRTYHLRAYIYQARDLLAGDDTGTSDPYCQIAFLSYSQSTERQEKTLSPTWDQTIVFEELEIPGDPALIKSQPPDITITVFDWDAVGKPDFLGRATALPIVKLSAEDSTQPKLRWFPIKTNSGANAGCLLAAFELFLADDGVDLPFEPPKRGDLFMVPSNIRPVLQRTAVEVLCWGVRELAPYQLLPVTSPSIDFEIGGHVMSSPVISNTKKNPNFPDPIVFFDIALPRDEIYTPPLNIVLRDSRQFGRKPKVGRLSIDLQPFRVQPQTADDITAEDLPRMSTLTENGVPDTVIELAPQAATLSKKVKPPSDEDLDWWSKFYASIGSDEKCGNYKKNGYPTIKIFPTELEEAFASFGDFCHSFEIPRGGKQIDDDEVVPIAGEFKGLVRVYQLPPDPKDSLPLRFFNQKSLPKAECETCVLRVYVIDAEGLQPKDSNGKSDPYVKLQVGKKKMSSRDQYKPNTLDPVFGQLFEMKVFLPLEKLLVLSVIDYDAVGRDDDIGSTTIDLENRYTSRHRATVGLPSNYYDKGKFVWNQIKKPKDILRVMCSKKSWPAPVYQGTNVLKIGKNSYRLEDFEKPQATQNPNLGPPEERLALHILNSIDLVPEHVETRSLHNALTPEIEQGKVRMWIELFPESLGPPLPPVDIAPRKAAKHFLRIIIYNTYDVILDETSITGEQMSDIYVKGWICGLEDDKQETDIHYRSMDGEGNFNWRMNFPFDYMPSENCVVVKKKEHFWSLDATEDRIKPRICLQVWDNDKFSADDFLGQVTLDLQNMPKPKKSASDCDLQMLPGMRSGDSGAANANGASSSTVSLPKLPFGSPPPLELINLFEQKRVKGVIPFVGEATDESGQKILAGKVEIEMEILTEEEALAKPAGKGQEEPNENPHLEPPKRPETSFLWFTSPWKTFKHIIWKRYKWVFIIGLILIILIIFVLLMLYCLPGAIWQAIL